MASEPFEFAARPLDDAFQVAYERSINRVVGHLERLESPFARGEQDREHGDVLLTGSDEVGLPAYAAIGTARARAHARG